MNEENKKVCFECGREATSRRYFHIDDKVVCARCLYGDIEPFEIYPIGKVENHLTRSRSGFGTRGSEGVSRIELLPSQKRFMYKLEEERFLTIVYYLHEAGMVESVFERGLDGKRTGLFATRTPNRLSRIAIQDVKVIEVEGTSLLVEGLDAVNGTPVLDIKLGLRRGDR